jgi:ABC-2 type transport system permease protein
VKTLRLLAFGWLMHMKMRTRSVFDGLLQIIWPLFFACIAFFLFGAGGDPSMLVYASLGARGSGSSTPASGSSSERSPSSATSCSVG